MSYLPLFPSLDMISRPATRPRKPHPKQMCLFYAKDYARYTLKLKRATPPWVVKRDISEAYRLARSLTRETGELHVVDHIVPINGGIVCGLHVPWNLQVVHWRVNGVKGARWWPNMPVEQGDLFNDRHLT